MVRWLVTCATEVGQYQTPLPVLIFFKLVLTFLSSGLFVHHISL